MRDRGVLEDISRLITLPSFQKLREEAERKLESNEASITRLVFKTRSPVDPLEVEYFRGFRQGVKYVLDGLPREIQSELNRELKNEGE